MQADYFGAYRHLNLSRDDQGVLVAEFHSNGGAFIVNAQSHTEFVDAFHRSLSGKDNPREGARTSGPRLIYPSGTVARLQSGARHG
jgi:hypothetical protein